MSGGVQTGNAERLALAEPTRAGWWVAGRFYGDHWHTEVEFLEEHRGALYGRRTDDAGFKAAVPVEHLYPALGASRWVGPFESRGAAHAARPLAPRRCQSCKGKGYYPAIPAFGLGTHPCAFCKGTGERTLGVRGGANAKPSEQPGGKENL